MSEQVVQIRELHFSYPDGTSALNGLNLDISKNECLGLIGPNGAGKTTALLAMCGLHFGDGIVSVNGQEMTRKNADDLRYKVGFVFQYPDDQLFMPTVFEDVAFGPENLGYEKPKVREKVQEALRAMELDGYENKSAHHLSGGEKKRVAIATVLSMQPEMLILDEPTTNLDPHSRRGLIKLLAGMDITKIIAGHDLEMILELCTKVAVLNDGKIAALGHPEELLANDQLMEENLLEVPYSLR
jgi:cobalt/nickel transport system ATP-binding protein